MYEVVDILSNVRGGAKDLINVLFLQVWLSSLLFFKHFSLDVTNKEASVAGAHFRCYSHTPDLLVIIAIKIKMV